MSAADPSGMKGFLNEWTMGPKPDAVDGKLAQIESRIGQFDRSISDNIRNPLNAIHSQTTALGQLVSQATENAVSSLEANINAIDTQVQDHAIARLTPLELNTDDLIATVPDKLPIIPITGFVGWCNPATGDHGACSADPTAIGSCLGMPGWIYTPVFPTVQEAANAAAALCPIKIPPPNPPTTDCFCLWYSPSGNCYTIINNCTEEKPPSGTQLLGEDAELIQCFPTYDEASQFAITAYGPPKDCDIVPPPNGGPPVPPTPSFCCPDLTPFESALKKIADCLCKLQITNEAKAQSGGDFSYLLSQDGSQEDKTIVDYMGITFDEFDQFASVADAATAYLNQWQEGGT